MELLKRFIYCFLLLVSSSCSFVQNPIESSKEFLFDRDLREIKVYFTKSKDPGNIIFIPVARKIPKEESVLDSSLRELFLGPTKKEELRGIMTEIPIGTRLIKLEESEDEILADISGQYLSGGGSATMQMRYLQLYKTLKNIAPDKKIYLLVDGKSLKAIGGEGVEITQPLSKISDYTKKYEKTEQP